jgi:hypothetical protein
MTFTTIGKPGTGNFTLVVTILIAGTIFFGFSHTILPDVLLRLRPTVLYLHVATAIVWLVLLVVQVALVRNRKVALHRKVGGFGLWVGAAASVSSLATALILRHDSVIRHGADRMEERIAFLAVPLNGFLIFSVALGLAALWRRRPAFHRRAIMLAAVSLMGAGLARVPATDTYPLIGLVVPNAVLLLLIGHDWWSERRIHPVYLVGAPLLIALGQATDYLANAHPAWWVATARVLIGV